MCAEWKTLAREFTKEEASEIRNAKSGTTPTLLTVNIFKWNSIWAQKKRNLIVVVAIKLCAITKFHSKKVLKSYQSRAATTSKHFLNAQEDDFKYLAVTPTPTRFAALLSLAIFSFHKFHTK